MRPSLVRAAAIAVGLLLACGVDADARADPPTRAGSRIDFHGWSPDSRYVAYTRVRNRPPVRRGAAPVVDRQRRHRRIEAGDFAGFGSKVGGDVAGHARAHGYVVQPLAARNVSPYEIHYDAKDRAIVLLVEADTEHIAWELRDRGAVVARHMFDALYVSVEVDLYPAPDGSQGVLVMHLDTGWVVDAAVYPVRLREAVPTARPKKRPGPIVTRLND